MNSTSNKLFKKIISFLVITYGFIFYSTNKCFNLKILRRHVTSVVVHIEVQTLIVGRPEVCITIFRVAYDRVNPRHHRYNLGVEFGHHSGAQIMWHIIDAYQCIGCRIKYWAADIVTTRNATRT